MQHPDRETLSQLMDGEWQDIDTPDCINGVCGDADLRATWARYHIIRDVMRNQPVEAAGDDMAERMRVFLADEPAHPNVMSIADRQPVSHQTLGGREVSGEQPTPRFSVRQGLGGLAVAASVAVATFVGINVWQQGAPGTPAAQVAENTLIGAPTGLDGNLPGTVLPQVELVANTGSYWVTSESERAAHAEERLNMFLAQHIEHSPTADRSGMLPYSKLVGYDEIVREER